MYSYIPDYTIHSHTLAVTSPQIVPWGLPMLRVPEAWKRTKGAKVVVAVFDTGVDRHHKDLNGNILQIRDYLGVYQPDELWQPAREWEPLADNDPGDGAGHGSHIAGIIAGVDNAIGVVGVAHKAKLLINRVMNHQGVGDDFAIYRAMLDTAAERRRWNETNGKEGLPVAVANLSLGKDEPSLLLEQGVKAMYAAGIKIVCAAGNDYWAGKDTVDYPARYPQCIAVAAVDDTKLRGRFSSTGPDVYVAAPGVMVTSTWMNGEYRTISGTSMSSPYVAGLIALIDDWHLQQYGRFTTPDEARELLRLWADDQGAVGRDPEYGFGIPVWRDQLQPEPVVAPAPEPAPSPGPRVIDYYIGDPNKYIDGQPKPLAAPLRLYRPKGSPYAYTMAHIREFEENGDRIEWNPGAVSPAGFKKRIRRYPK